MDFLITWKRLGVICFICAGTALVAAQTTSGSDITFSVGGRVGFVLNKGIVAADFTHSGQLSYAFLSSAVGLWVENPAGLYRLQLLQNADPDQLQVADFNNDGNLDIAVELRAANRINILLGHGDGTFEFAPDVILTGPPARSFPRTSIRTALPISQSSSVRISRYVRWSAFKAMAMALSRLRRRSLYRATNMCSQPA